MAKTKTVTMETPTGKTGEHAGVVFDKRGRAELPADDPRAAQTNRHRAHARGDHHFGHSNRPCAHARGDHSSRRGTAPGPGTVTVDGGRGGGARNDSPAPFGRARRTVPAPSPRRGAGAGTCPIDVGSRTREVAT